MAIILFEIWVIIKIHQTAVQGEGGQELAVITSPREHDMNNKTVLITGANKSIGYETARQLGRLGYRIWLGSRDDARGAASVSTLLAEGLDVRLLPIDVTNDESVRTGAALVMEKDGKLDALINNAGIPGAAQTLPSQQAISDIRNIFETNVFGPIRVTQAFLPSLKAAGTANVVMVSSGLGSLGWRTDPANFHSSINLLGYNSSKTALNAVTVCFAQELAEFGIRVNAADPGYTATDFNGHTGYRTVEQAATGIVQLASLNSSGPTGGFYFEEKQVPW
jgi:NAD(P)-dependent dehydrogenase (short-subunit alcohol dehydrogenase family)